MGSRHQRAELLGAAVQGLRQMFPKICPTAASALLAPLLKVLPPEQAMQCAVEDIIEKGFPAAIGRTGNEASTSNAASKRGGGRHASEDILVNLLSSSDSDSEQNYPERALDADSYREWCIFVLQQAFPRVPMPAIRDALNVFRGELIPTYKSVNLQFCRTASNMRLDCVGVQFLGDQGSEDTTWLRNGKLRLLKRDRRQHGSSRPETDCPRFERDWKALQLEKRSVIEFDQVSVDDVEDFTPQEEMLIECGCCYSESPFEELVQCADGHLFCTACLRRHLEGYIFGVAQTCGLPLCMDTNGCDKTFPSSELRKSLPPDVLSKYEQRQAEDAVARAKLEGLVYCPFCSHPWEVDPGTVVLNCRNETCKKASCIKCKEPSHQPQRCEDVEKKSETAARRKVEEQMTKALIRECISCRAELVKIEGCNKITCRCGQIMCYVCRKPITNYSHFCGHIRDAGKQCTQCDGCSLWEKENVAEVVKAAKAAAIEEAGTQDPALRKRDIGPSDSGRHHKKPRLYPVP